MMRYHAPALLAGLVCLSSAQAEFQLFPRGAEALKYGAYTGGHGYSYNTAYGYGFAFSSADTWRRDPFAYPAGIYPYRPYGWPITYRVCPTPPTPYVSVPGPDGLPVLVRPDAVPNPVVLPPGRVISPNQGQGLPALSPVPGAAQTVVPMSSTMAVRSFPSEAGGAGVIRIAAPAGAEVWVDKQKLSPNASFKTPALTPGTTRLYSVRARWTEAGKEVEQFHVVNLRAGESAQLTFSQPK